MKTKSKTQKLISALARRALTNQQIQTQCGFLTPSSVTAAIAHLKRDGFGIRVAGKSKEGTNRYTLA